MAITIFNTLTKCKEEFVPLEPGKVKFYLCGPTVYDYFHIGNARPFILFDVYRRFLEYRGFEVTFVVNLTDIDDRIIRRSLAENRPAAEVAEEFSRAYFIDIESLRIRRANVHPRATEHIQEMLQLIQKLLDRGIAYTLAGDVYYNVRKFARYGQLSGKKIEELQAGARIEVDERKQSPLDFALWKTAKPGEPSWDSPWGKGRPGWHIECSAMSMKYLGVSFDIHAGGEDLIFPHHENEIAQSCGAENGSFARYWMHNGFLNIRDEKMSKSLGNFITVREMLKRHRPEVIRLFFLQKHYRSPINYSEEILLETENGWQRLQNFYNSLAEFNSTKEPISTVALTPVERDFYQDILRLKEELIAALEDDFNSAQAIGKLYEIVKESNRVLNREKLSSSEKLILGFVKEIIEEMDGFLSLIYHEEDSPRSQQNVNELLDLIVEIRNQLRDKKEWELSDLIRDRLKILGYSIEDQPNKSIWKKN